MWHRQIEWIDPVEAASRLQALPFVAFLDSAMAHPTLGRYAYLGADPFGLFRARRGRASWNGAAEAGSVGEALKRRLASFRCDMIEGLPPFQGGAIGAFAYDWGWSLEGRALPSPPVCDDVHLGFYDVVVTFDLLERCCFIVSSGWPENGAQARRVRAEARLSAMTEWLARPAATPDDLKTNLSLKAGAPWRPAISRMAYGKAVDRVKRYIRDGDIYQANIAQRFTASLPRGLAPWTVYRALREANPAPFAAYIDDGAQTILSTSPELFLKLRNGRVETRPIKGTGRRDANAARDMKAREALLGSRKDRAENVMIVDLLRNDLSKVCTPESVDVPVLCGLESYEGLHHLVSTVTGRLREGADAVDLLCATFPGGSITGAPKLRAMEIIAEIEGRSRGVYCGSIGAMGFDGSLDLNIAIRTLVVSGHAMELCAGGGITILSDPDAEYEETITKAQRIFDALSTPELAADALA